MKAISLWQPWASLWACTDRKLHETRHWKTPLRGWILVHAAKKQVCSAIEKTFGKNDADRVKLCELLIDEWGGHWAKDLPHGALVGAVYLYNVVSTESVRHTLSEDDALLGNFAPARYSWLKSRRVAFEKPIPYKGRQNIFEVPDEVVLGLIPWEEKKA